MRPSSAYIKKTTNEEERNLNPIDKNKIKIEKLKTEDEIVPLLLQNKCIVPLKGEVRPLPLIVKNNVYNPNQYRCKSSEAQRNPKLL
jgi:hypothetical protein